MSKVKQVLKGVGHALVAVIKAEPVRVATWLVAGAVAVGLTVPDQATSIQDIGAVLLILVGGEGARTQVEPKEQ